MPDNPYSNPYQTPAANIGGVQSVGAGDGVSSATVDILVRTRPWALFVAVLGLIGVGFLVVAAIGLLAVFSQLGSSGIGLVMALLYFAIAAIYALPCIRLVQYCSAITRLRTTPTSASLENALDRQRSFWKTIGIMILIGILLGVLMAIVSATATVSTPSGRYYN
ncbi:MAG: hypothetical protein ACR2RV_23525 [Verrucomicrobiales bacterium]